MKECAERAEISSFHDPRRGVILRDFDLIVYMDELPKKVLVELLRENRVTGNIKDTKSYLLKHLADNNIVASDEFIENNRARVGRPNEINALREEYVSLGGVVVPSDKPKDLKHKIQLQRAINKEKEIKITSKNHLEVDRDLAIEKYGDKWEIKLNNLLYKDFEGRFKLQIKKYASRS